jgi:tetratricopeptide (TPR) repeat protein
MMRTLLIGLSVCLVWLLTLACSPKTTGSTTAATTGNERPSSTTKPKAKPDRSDELSPCPKFTDAPSPEDAEDNYVIYRSALKAKEMDRAMETWREVYAVSPAADGRRPTVYTDGVAFYNYLIQQNPAQQQAYGDTILMLYEQARECYQGDGYMAAMQGFDSYYTYPGSATDEEIYELFKESIETDGADELQYFVINPMSRLVVDQHEAGKIDDAEARAIVTALMTRLEKGLEECRGSNCEAWKAIEAYAPSSLMYFETVKGFYDCDYYVDRYYNDFQENPDDFDVITTAYTRLRWADCGQDRPELQAVATAYRENRPKVPSSTGSTLRRAYDALQEGDARAAVALFEQAAEETDDNERKGRYFLTAAKVYYGNLRNFAKAREMARKSIAADGTSGEPYMLIGTLYASSGPLCGPGTGFDSQVVTWPAIDKWQQAKRIDPSVAAEANRLINRYSQYMPSKSDIFSRGIEEGSSYTVGCWIQETTRVRTP